MPTKAELLRRQSSVVTKIVWLQPWNVFMTQQYETPPREDLQAKYSELGKVLYDVLCPLDTLYMAVVLGDPKEFGYRLQWATEIVKNGKLLQLAEEVERITAD